jgi:hypothetical protein
MLRSVCFYLPLVIVFFLSTHGRSQENSTLAHLAIADSSETTDKSGSARRLFYIERNKNANIVIYEAQVESDGSLRSEDPVIAYWLMNEEDGHRQDLNRFERKRAYGFDSELLAKDSVLLELKADIKRDVVVSRVGDNFKAVTIIEGKKASLDRIYIMADESGFRPDVQYLELFGKDLYTEEDLYEKSLP